MENTKLAYEPGPNIWNLNIQHLWHLPAMANEKELRDTATNHKKSLRDLNKAHANARTNELLIAEPPSAERQVRRCERLRDLLASLR